jgi:hypothetical protein
MKEHFVPILEQEDAVNLKQTIYQLELTERVKKL